MDPADDEPRTPVERQADFFIGLITGAGLVLGFALLRLRASLEVVGILGGWLFLLLPAFVLGCGWLNYRLGAQFWSRK